MGNALVNLSGKSVVVVGLGRSGVSAARLAHAHGARVVATDTAVRERVSPEALALAELPGVSLVLGGHDGVPFDRSHLIVVSPGVPPLPLFDAAERAGIEVIGELEFAWRALSDVPTVAIGGTNGKSTTTTLVGEMAKADGLRTFVGGNLGTPLSDAVPRDFARQGSLELDLLVLEVSSYQAERMPTFHPRAATLLNITPDHLDRYPDIRAYGDAKGNMLARMTAEDTVVVPAGDAETARQAARSGARVVTFGPGGDVHATPEEIVDGTTGRRYARRQILLRGDHNALNIEASIALATAMGLREGAIASALASFPGLAHRIAFVAEIRGVRYYDDSKGTNVGASVAALRGLSEPRAVVILGGRDKLGAYDPLVQAMAERGRAAVLLGEAAPRIEEALRGVLPTVRADSMDDAVEKASALAEPGDAVLLSPACSSFDMFRDYKHRGDAFVHAARALAERSLA